ncbi:MAG: pyruvate formate lyase family protein [Armatimonadota bacterium]
MGTNIDLAMLREIGEWAALGFYEGIDLPWPRAYGLALRRLYENMEVIVPDDRYLIPCEPFAHAHTWESHNHWAASALACDFHHHCGFRATRPYAEEKMQRFPHLAPAIAAFIDDLETRFVYHGGYTHSNPDIRRVVHEGFAAMEAELDAELIAVTEDDDARPLLLALKDYAIGVRSYHQRAVQAVRQATAAATGARREKLGLIAESLAGGFITPSKTFLQGLLAINFTWMLDGCDSIGRFDQALGTLFEQDLRNGVLNVDFARELLDELWRNFERMNGWNLQIGGYTPEGRDGANALTLECIAACERNRFRRPNVAFRVTQHTPDDALIAALRALGKGSGRPALYNDDLYVDTLFGMDLGLTREDAREIGFGGCTETMIAGMSNVGSLEGEINLAKALELALHDGYDPILRQQIGPHTGRFIEMVDFDAFLTAVKRQIQFQTDAQVTRWSDALRRRMRESDPMLARTLFTRDCVKNRKSFVAGGARYNWAVVSYQGIANLIDSLAAVRTCVFEEGSITRTQLLAALESDFQGFAQVRQQLQAAPKFGNDDPSVDDLGHDIIRYAWDELYQHETPRGGRYIASCILFMTYLGAGQQVGATPDGRQAREVLTDSVGAAQGRDTHGPTALLNSVTKLPLARAAGTPVLNVRFQPKIMQDEEGLRGVAALVRTFFAQGGMQVQLSVLNQDELRAAQREPEKYRDLIVRVGGYSEYFTNLPRELQDSVIARTEYAV